MPPKRQGSGKKDKKEKAKNPKVQIKELQDENELLTEQLNLKKNEAEEMKTKLKTVNAKILTGLDPDTLKKHFEIEVNENTDPFLLSTDVLLGILDKVVVKRKTHEVSVEARLAELESRVTCMTLALAKNSKKALAYETALQDLLVCDSMDAVRDKVHHLQFVAGQAYHDVTNVDPVHTTQNFPAIEGLDGENDQPDSRLMRNLATIQSLNLVSPKVKSPGTTKVSQMNKDLKLYLTEELSLEKASGRDWRMFAERCGIPEETIEEWKLLKLESPMARVFQEWCLLEKGVTVRILHRHLASPQMRCTLLAKYISDFYEVD